MEFIQERVITTIKDQLLELVQFIIKSGDWVVDLSELEKGNEFNGELFGKLERKIFQSEYLNDFMGLSRPYWK